MKKYLSAALALTIAAGSLAAAPAASAWDRDHDHHRDRHHDRDYDRYDDRDYYHDRYRAERDYDKAMRKADRAYAKAERARWRAAERRYRAGVYRRPPGWAYRDWHYGDRLPRAYYVPAYYHLDHHHYGLYAPPPGHRWTRVNNDAVLTAVATGVIAGVVAGLFE